MSATHQSPTPSPTWMADRDRPHCVWGAAPPDTGGRVVRRSHRGRSQRVAAAMRGMGTTNFLIGLGAGAYLEIIGPDPDQPQPVGGRWFGIDRLTPPHRHLGHPYR